MTKLMRNIVLCILMLVFAVPAMAGDKAPALTEEQKAMLEAALENLETEIPIAEEFRVKVDPDDLVVDELIADLEASAEENGPNDDDVATPTSEDGER